VDKAVGSRKLADEPPHIIPGQHHWQALRFAGHNHLGQVTWVDTKHIAVEKQQRAARLVLRACRHIALHGEMVEEGDDRFAERPEAPLRSQLRGGPSPAPRSLLVLPDY
jgi:hypothetical protein